MPLYPNAASDVKLSNALIYKEFATSLTFMLGVANLGNEKTLSSHQTLLCKRVWGQFSKKSHVIDLLCQK
eukprot:5412249-Amphidinium_carterae.1